MDALVAQRQMIKGKWNCDFPNMKPDGENSLEFRNDGLVRQITEGTSTTLGPSIRMRAEQVGAYSANAEGLLMRVDTVVIHEMAIDGLAPSAELLKSMEERMTGDRTAKISPIIVLDEHNLVLRGSDDTVESQLKCTR